MSFYWHDYETWGEVPSRDKPVQFAGVRTDEDLNLIGEPLMIYCAPTEDLIPKPEACLITGITPQLAQEKGLREFEFIANIHAELSQPGTCGVGYNSIRFDDEVTRYALYRNFYDPYEREWRNGNSRWDLIDVVRMTRALRPEGIEWPNYEDGRPCFKLSELTRVNQLAHEAAHDALSDVYATISLARLIKTKQPKLFEYALRLRDKKFVGSLIDLEQMKPLLHISSRFANEQGNAALIVPLAFHPTNKNCVISFNLSEHPQQLLDLSLEDIKRRLYTRADDLEEGETRIALKGVHLNKSPMLLPPSMLDDETARRLNLNRQACELHWQWLRQLSAEELTQLRKKLFDLYSDSDFENSTDPEQQLYAGFIGDKDKQLMQRVRRMSPQQLAVQPMEFDDKRLPELLFRYRARNFPESLTLGERKQWNDFCLARMTQADAGGSMLAAEAQQTIQLLLQSEGLSERDQNLLTQLNQFIEVQLASVQSR